METETLNIKSLLNFNLKDKFKKKFVYLTYKTNRRKNNGREETKE